MPDELRRKPTPQLFQRRLVQQFSNAHLKKILINLQFLIENVTNSDKFKKTTNSNTTTTVTYISVVD